MFAECNRNLSLSTLLSHSNNTTFEKSVYWFQELELKYKFICFVESFVVTIQNKKNRSPRGRFWTIQSERCWFSRCPSASFRRWCTLVRQNKKKRKQIRWRQVSSNLILCKNHYYTYLQSQCNSPCYSCKIFSPSFFLNLIFLFPYFSILNTLQYFQ